MRNTTGIFQDFTQRDQRLKGDEGDGLEIVSVEHVQVGINAVGHIGLCWVCKNELPATFHNMPTKVERFAYALRFWAARNQATSPARSMLQFELGPADPGNAYLKETAHIGA